MKIEQQTLCRLSLFIFILTGIAGCGESDLVDIHERELDEAIAALNQPDLAPANPENTVNLAQYELVFNDEFNGDSIDYSKWNTALSWGPDFVVYNQLQYYVDTENDTDFGYNPFSFDGEALTISAIETPENLRVAANEQGWLSGVLSTAENFNLTYGYIEARMKVNEGRGVWPAFWMLSSELEGIRPELFVMEYDGAKPDSVFHNYNYRDSNGDLRTPGQREILNDNFSDSFHTLAVRWTDEELLFYIDGSPTYRIIGDNIPRQSMYLILNLAIGGIWPGSPDATTEAPATLSIDYIRAYQLRS
ncbi:MAG: glycoside hydrolase family 16 protein [Granulosicoccus sp.]|nr:glycoside hydrolase family 16 protein [Granulosicoccus sp.]